MSRSLILILCFTLLSFGVTVTTDAQTTVYNNFGAGHSGWDYNYGLGWTVSGENVPSQYGVEQAMSFRATASGTVSDIWVAMWYVPFEPQVDVVTVRLAKNPNGQPPLPQDVLEEWTITGIDPGMPMPGGMATLPLNWDLFTITVIGFLNTQPFTNFMGTLDASGNASARFDTGGPLPVGTMGLVFHFAYTLSSPFDLASNPIAVEVIR